MARVVQRRSSGPPYLLIIMVFLFLAATTVAVLMYNNYDKAATSALTAKGELSKFIADNERNSPRLPSLLKTAEPSATGRPGRSVFSQLNEEIDKLVQIVRGTSGTSEVALAEGDQAQTLAGNKIGLAPLVKALRDQAEAEQARAAAAAGDLAAANKAMADLKKEWAGKLDAAAASVAKANQDLASEQKKTRDLIDAQGKALEAAKAEYNKAQEDLNKSISDKADQITKLTTQVAKLEAKVREQEAQIAELTGKKGEVQYVQTAGKVYQVKLKEGVAYIDIGTKDHVRAGMTFAVYSSSKTPAFTEEKEEKGNGKSFKGKASLVVTNASDTISECRIENAGLDPVIEGDPIVNVAFNKNRQYTFVVEGVFDLYGTNKPTEAGADEVRSLIRKDGGDISTDINVQTDYVVVGQQPAAPPKPPENADQTAWKVWEEQMKVHKRYQEVIDMAVKMNKRILNTNQFLDLIGYTPTKTLKY